MQGSTARHADTIWTRRSQLSILGLAFVLRAGWALAVPVKPVSDSFVYDLLARSLVNGIGYSWAPGQPTAYWPVGTSFVYSVLYRFFGVSYTPIVVFNLAISLVGLWLTMRLARRWFNDRVALTAGLLLAIWPLQVEFTTVLASELIFNLLLLAMLAVWEARRPHRLIRAALIGLLAAALCYIRPIGVFLPAILYAVSIRRERRYGPSLAATAVAFLVMGLAVLPWSVRNTRIFGHLVLVSTNGGANMWMGNHPGASGGTMPIPDNTLQMQEAERNLYLGNLAEAYIRAHPIRFVGRTLKKVVMLYDHETIGVHWNRETIGRLYGARVLWGLKLFSDLFWWAALPLSLAGIWIRKRRIGFWRLLASPPVLVIGYFTALYAVVVVQDRYHFSMEPFLAMFAALALDTGWKKWTERRRAQAA